MAAKPTYGQLEKRVRELERGESALKRALKTLTESEERTSLEGDEMPSPEEDLEGLKLSDVIDAKAIQSMMDDFYRLTRMGIAILDRDGNILVSTGWQDICTRFHRKHPETRENCLKSDLELSDGIEPGAFRLYRCKNNMWDMATPIMVRGKRLGILYLGQFVFEDEVPDLDVFRAQAQKYGFDEKSYMDAFDRVPRWKRETVDTVMSFYVKLADLISELSFSNIRLARSLKERTRIQNALAEARRFESMGSLAVGLAQDYNNLLSMILGNITMAKDDMGTGRFAGGFLDDAEEATLKAQDLTHRLMTLSKGSGSYKRLRSVKDSLEVCAGEISRFSNCICNLSLDPDLWPAEHDSGQLKYAIRNVLENGVEAMPKGGVLSLKAENVALPKDKNGPDMPEYSENYLKISIADHGVGISKAKLARVFDPYFSTKEAGSRKGTGLGLTIVHAIINRHGGYIALDSKRGTGTTVYIYLPAKPPEDPA
jgi:polar amino acid transport system substrate-binding protein